jgi:hypothetical protein
MAEMGAADQHLTKEKQNRWEEKWGEGGGEIAIDIAPLPWPFNSQMIHF